MNNVKSNLLNTNSANQKSTQNTYLPPVISQAIERDANRLASATVRGYDFDVEGPRLPEEGLRSAIQQHVMRILRRQDVCGRDDRWAEMEGNEA